MKGSSKAEWGGYLWTIWLLNSWCRGLFLSLWLLWLFIILTFLKALLILQPFYILFSSLLKNISNSISYQILLRKTMLEVQNSNWRFNLKLSRMLHFNTLCNPYFIQVSHYDIDYANFCKLIINTHAYFNRLTGLVMSPRALFLV